MKRLLSTLGALALASAVSAQQPALERQPAPFASPEGKAEIIAPRPVQPAEDPVVRFVNETTIEGLVVSITIDGKAVTLDGASLARVPRKQARADRKVEGDAVTATAMAGAQVVATTVVPDNVLNAEEGRGLVRTERRQLVIALAADRPVDKVVIDAPATGARGELDVRGVFARMCEMDARSKWCRR